MIWSLFFSLLLAQSPCEKQTHTSPDYLELKSKIDKKIDSASNLVTIATEADQILSKLIAAQSPVLLTWLQKRQLLEKKEEEIAQEWRRYYLNNFIFDRFPSKNNGINTSVENLFSEINSMSFDEKTKKKFEDVFKKAKASVKKFVLSLPLLEDDRKKAIHRLDTINLYWFEKIAGTRYQSKPLEFIRWGMAYDPQHNEINMGVQARQYPSDANLFSVFAHEMAHSIDPCRWSFYIGTNNPFEKVIQCLRSDNSVAAKKRDDSKMQWALDKKVLNKEMADSLQKHLSCNRSFYPPKGTQKDQILESFADWLSAEAFAIGPYSNQFPRADLCQTKELMEGSSYPSNLARLEKIYLSQPQLQKLSKSKKPASHCIFQ